MFELMAGGPLRKAGNGWELKMEVPDAYQPSAVPPYLATKKGKTVVVSKVKIFTRPNLPLTPEQIATVLAEIPTAVVKHLATRQAGTQPIYASSRDGLGYYIELAQPGDAGGAAQGTGTAPVA
jgi:hypothetical protein